MTSRDLQQVEQILKPPTNTTNILRDKKFLRALVVGVIVFGISLVLSFVAFRGETSIVFYEGFPEWEQTTSIALSLPAVLEDSARQILAAIQAFLLSFNDANIASIVRWTGIFAILLIMLLIGDQLTSERHDVYRELGQKIFFDRRQGKFKNYIARFALSIATLTSAYVIITVLCLLGHQTFQSLELNIWGAVLLTAFLASLIAFAFTYWSISVSARELLVLAIATLFFGIFSGFSFSGADETGRYAWQYAISHLGESALSNWLFAGTLLSVGTILSVLAYYLNGFVLFVAKVEGKSAPYQWGVASAWIAAVIGMVTVGLVPSNSDSSWIHFAGAILGFGIMIGLMVFLILDWKSPVFSDTTIYVTYILVGVGGMATVIFVGGLMFSESDWGITLTGIELILLGIASTLMVMVVDGLLDYADAHHEQIPAQ